ncbi:pseudouridine synthase [Fomitiporia mediterranea MF3/22]|uniref:pseudouridine synthase n=1 Tax=Fomitiporia mediterranea (strain MF3/22) TaxID=694068 RepID=UPI00044091D3|nr:pseudouridine synthase [Fomitiporia mediterranea MF3/22]EJD02471.1 pseudouridine synthase [Fomitiporia mediterranea MF3/22]
MPKSTVPPLSCSALFGISKPSGPSSMSVINDLKKLVSASRLFVDEESAKVNAERLYSVPDGEDEGEGGVVERDGRKGGREKGKWKRMRGKGRKGREVEAKMGQGGTLDPLADGVLVVGVNKGTKKLSEFLDCIKEYRTTCLLGCETDTYDSEGAQVRTAPWKHVTKEKVEAALEQFRGDIQQTPPVFSALKMDGKPLYEYAREGIPLPRPIERRPVTVHSLEITHWIPGSEHSYEFPTKKFSEEERAKMVKALRGVELSADAEIKDEPEQQTDSVEGSTGDAKDDGDKPTEERPPVFVLSMRVSGGTYVRSIVHDVGHALGSAAHVVTLTRSRQGRFVLKPSTKTSTPMLPEVLTNSEVNDTPEVSEEKSDDAELAKQMERECIPWDVFARAMESRATEEPDEDGWREWEREVMDNLEIVEGK